MCTHCITQTVQRTDTYVHECAHVGKKDVMMSYTIVHTFCKPMYHILCLTRKAPCLSCERLLACVVLKAFFRFDAYMHTKKKCIRVVVGWVLKDSARLLRVCIRDATDIFLCKDSACEEKKPAHVMARMLRCISCCVYMCIRLWKTMHHVLCLACVGGGIFLCGMCCVWHVLVVPSLRLMYLYG